LGRKTSLIHGVEIDVKTDIKAAKRIQVHGWKAWSFIIAAAVFVILPLALIRHDELVYPITDSAIAFGFLFLVKWQLRDCRWFWIVIGVLAAAHVAVILSVHWTDGWVWSRTNAGLATLDFIVMLVAVDAVGRVMKRFHPSRNSRAHSIAPDP